MKKFKVWECQVVVDGDTPFPFHGFDSVPRGAVIDAIQDAGVNVVSCFSGWGGELSPIRQEMAEEDARREATRQSVAKEAPKDPFPSFKPELPDLWELCMKHGASLAKHEKVTQVAILELYDTLLELMAKRESECYRAGYADAKGMARKLVRYLPLSQGIRVEELPELDPSPDPVRMLTRLVNKVNRVVSPVRHGMPVSMEAIEDLDTRFGETLDLMSRMAGPRTEGKDPV